jgi:hypothetical protein
MIVNQITLKSVFLEMAKEQITRNDNLHMIKI